MEFWEEFASRKPNRNEVLVWKLGDPVRYDTQKLKNGQRRLWCDPLEIAACRGVAQYDWHLPAKNEAAFDALPEDERLYHLVRPHPNAEHLFTSKPCEWKQKRIDDLLAALMFTLPAVMP